MTGSEGQYSDWTFFYFDNVTWNELNVTKFTALCRRGVLT